jgi:hypothetical protein
MYPKMGLVEETMRGGKKERMIANNNEIYHICVGIRQNETHWKLLSNPG